jgi:integrase
VPRRRLLPQWVTEFRDRHGKPRLRYRRVGYPSYYFKAQLGTEEFRVEYRHCLDNPIRQVGLETNAPGSIGDLIARWYKGTQFTNGGPATQMKNRGLLEGFRAAHGDKMVETIQFEHIDAILAARARAHPTAAHNLRKQLRRLFAFAVKCRMRPDNPVEHTTAIRMRDDAGHKAWTEADVAAYQARWALGTMPRLALEIMLWTGNRKGDALKLGRQHIKNGDFRIVQEKTKKTVIIPIAPALARAIIAMPDNGQLTLITTSHGKPYSAKGFGARMRVWCDAAGLTDKSAHGLRKTISERMALSGAGNPGIKSVTGHSGDSEVALYTRGVDQERLARETMRALVAWELSNREDDECLTAAKPAE